MCTSAWAFHLGRLQYTQTLRSIIKPSRAAFENSLIVYDSNTIKQIFSTASERFFGIVAVAKSFFRKGEIRCIGENGNFRRHRRALIVQNDSISGLRISALSRKIDNDLYFLYCSIFIGAIQQSAELDCRAYRGTKYAVDS